MQSPFYIFIVGVGRSGTKYIKNILSSHPEINISVETHFFSKFAHNGFIKAADKIGDMQKDENVKELVGMMFSKKIFGSFWKSGHLIDREKIQTEFLASDRKYSSFFKIILEADKEKHNKTIAGEKTPSHIFHVDELMEWFPSAKVLHIVRNPKAVLASDIKKEVKPDYPLKKTNPFYNIGIFFTVFYSWSRAATLDDVYKKKYPENYLSMRYEDLIKDHENKVRELCLFLNVEFNPAMLNPPVTGSSFEGKAGKKASKSYFFKKQFDFMINLFLKSKLKKYGYFILLIIQVIQITG